MTVLEAAPLVNGCSSCEVTEEYAPGYTGTVGYLGWYGQFTDHGAVHRPSPA